MPKVKYITPKNVPPPDMVKELFRRYQKATGISNEELSQQLGKTNQAVRSRKCRGWLQTIDELQSWAVALGVPADELGEAILYRGSKYSKLGR